MANDVIVEEVVAPSAVPADVRRAAETILERFELTWAAVRVTARITPLNGEAEETWLVAVNGDALHTGVRVDISDGSWTATSSRMSFGDGQQARTRRSVLVAERATAAREG